MAYNHGREDRKWRIWKEAEEKLLRECGVDEATIEQIRIADRADFNSNRRFYRWTNDVAEYLEDMADRERWRYLQKLDARNSLLSLDGFTDSEGNPLDFIADEAADIAETVVNAVMVDRLNAALPLLSDSEQELIQAIFFDGLSEREVGARLGITQSVVNKRKARILIKLRKMIES